MQAGMGMGATGAHYAIYQELQQSVHDLSTRGLYHAAQWAAEQLVGLDLHESESGVFCFGWWEGFFTAGAGSPCALKGGR